MPHQTNVRSNSAEHINPPLPDSIPTLGSLFTANGADLQGPSHLGFLLLTIIYRVRLI